MVNNYYKEDFEVMINDMLFNWQKPIIENNKDKDAFGLFIDCGLGKTPLSLSLAEINNCDRILIITINSKAVETVNTSGSWEEWLLKYNCTEPFKVVGKKRKYTTEDLSSKYVAMIMNYESLFERKPSAKEKTPLKKEVVDFVNTCKNRRCAIIVDESHKMKNIHSKQTESIFKIQKQMKLIASTTKTYLLTGTPFTVGYEDLYSQLKALGVSITKTQFVDRYCIKDNRPGLLGWQQPIIGYKNVDELFDVVHSVALTIKQEDVLDLPESIFVDHKFKKSDSFATFMSEKLTGTAVNKLLVNRGYSPDEEFDSPSKVNNPFFRNFGYPNMSYIADTPSNLWLRARELSIGFQGNAEKYDWYDFDRINELKRFLEQNEDNYILFYNYTPELLEIYNVCEELDYNIDVYSGDIKSTIFYDAYASQSEGDRLVNNKNIIIANYKSGSTGKNWQLYNKCILFSLPLYSDYEQGIKRIRRIGQKNTTVYHIFYQDNWLDRKMKNALEQKIDYSAELFMNDFKKEILK